MSDSSVRKALNTAALDFLTVVTSISTSKGVISGLPIIPASHVAWENRDFTAPQGSLWASVFFVPNVPEGRTVGVGGIDEMNGFLQIDFNVGMDAGDSELLSWEDKARIYFTAGTSFKHDNQNVLVLSAGLGQGRIIQNNFRKSLTVAFSAQLKRYIKT